MAFMFYQRVIFLLVLPYSTLSVGMPSQTLTKEDDSMPPAHSMSKASNVSMDHLNNTIFGNYSMSKTNQSIEPRARKLKLKLYLDDYDDEDDYDHYSELYSRSVNKPPTRRKKFNFVQTKPDGFINVVSCDLTYVKQFRIYGYRTVIKLNSAPSGVTELDWICSALSSFKEKMKSEVNWYQASEMCEKVGQNLASIDSLDEQLRLEGILRAKGMTEKAWIGGNDLIKEGEYWWKGGKYLKYTNWNTGEPNNHYGKEDCIEILITFKWNDVPCSINKYYICEYFD